MKASIEMMVRAICHELGDMRCSIYLTGSAVLGDFRFGWSDIDILCLTDGEMKEAVMARIVDLRQRMQAEEPDNPYYRLFEGMILPLKAAASGLRARAVYWGTTGQRIREDAVIGVFERMALIDHAKLIHGAEVRSAFERPDWVEIRHAVLAHSEGIARVCTQVKASMYMAGWMLDIARCLYTLQTGKMIAKTKAGEWAMTQGLCPDPTVMTRVLELRYAPQKYAEMRAWTETLPAHIMRFNDVLLAHLSRMVDVEIDRPLGSVHPKHKDMVYPINYGYVPGVIGGDGDERDVYVIGVDEPLKRFSGEIIAEIHRRDDAEEKWVAAPACMRFSKDEICTATHFMEQYFDSEIRMMEVAK